MKRHRRLVHLVEDNADVAMMLRISLDVDGIDVVLIEPEDALNRDSWKDAKVAIVDLMLPHISGIDVLRYLKENHPNVKRVVLTAMWNPDKEVHDLADKVLPKASSSLRTLLEAVSV